MEFLRFVVNDLYKKFEGQLENVTVVLPTRRAALFIRKYLAELAGDKPVCAPQCTTTVSYTHLRAHETDSYLV